MSRPAAGRATASGMDFQAMVATWCAAHLAADMPVGPRFGLATDVRIETIQSETGDAVDDIVLGLVGGGQIFFQCKTHPTITRNADSPFAKAIEQVAVLQATRPVGVQTPPWVAVIAVAEDAGARLDHLAAGLRQFDAGGQWSEAIGRIAEGQKTALEMFAGHARRKWTALGRGEMTDSDLEAVARLTRIERFSADVGGRDWREAVQVVGNRLYGDVAGGTSAVEELHAQVRDLTRSGALATREGLLGRLRRAGKAPRQEPRYGADILALERYSADEQRRLARHQVLPIAGGVALDRECLAALSASVEDASLLVTGAPGAGKTGVLLSLAQHQPDARPVVFLSVERLAQAGSRRAIADELRLMHDPLEVLEQWPGDVRGLLVIDALDASRGGSAEAVIAGFVEEALSRLADRWSVVASIRSFDLTNGRRFRALMPGQPPQPAFVEAGLADVRHFRIPTLSDVELEQLAARSPMLSQQLADAPEDFLGLLRNVFNLSLAADLVERGRAADLNQVNSQSQLLDLYERERMPSQAAIRAAKASVAAMVEYQRLAVQQAAIEHDEVQGLLDAGVLVPAGQLVTFNHNVLFDHVAGTHYLEWANPGRLHKQIGANPAIGLMLGPALRFAMERLWAQDVPGKPQIWGLLETLAKDAGSDPVIRSIALRTAAEQVASRDDVAGLVVKLSALGVEGGMVLSLLARFMGMVVPRPSQAAACAWCELSEAAATSRAFPLLDGARVILWTLAERIDLSDPVVGPAFGRAARALLESAWALDPPQLQTATAAIQLVAKSYASDVPASRALLDQILEARFAAHGAREASWLAGGIETIIPADPDFAVKIYQVLFCNSSPQTGTTWFGGAPSRLLPLTSTFEQDYEQARWRLGRAIKGFLRANPAAGLRAVAMATIGIAVERERLSKTQERLETDTGTVLVWDDRLTLQDWRRETQRGSTEAPVLQALVEVLRTCSASAYRTMAETAKSEAYPTAIWARMFGMAADRDDAPDDLLWPVATSLEALTLLGLSRDAIIYVAAAYGRMPRAAREGFERRLVTAADRPDAAESPAGKILPRLLTQIREEDLVDDDLRQRRRDLAGSGGLQANPPPLSVTFGWGSREGIVDSMLADAGVDLKAAGVGEVRDAGRALEDLLQDTPDDAPVEDLTTLWDATLVLVARLDALAPLAPDELARPSWGDVSNAVERLCKAAAYDPAVPGLPDLETLNALIGRLELSPWPDAETDDEGIGWGNWDVRVYAASSLMALAPRFAEARPQIVEAIARLARDAVATVRLQVAQSLNTLWDVARNEMWRLIAGVSEAESSRGVLTFFVLGPLERLAATDPPRIMGLIHQVLERHGNSADSGRTDFCEVVANLVARLYVVHENPQARAQLDAWAEDFERGAVFLGPALHWLRTAFFATYEEVPDQRGPDVQARAKEILTTTITAAAAMVSQAQSCLEQAGLDAATRAEWEGRYRIGDQILDQAANQLYFGSGAFVQRADRDPVGLPSPEAKRRFLIDYAEDLALLVERAGPQALHHLVELYEFTAEGDPGLVFDQIAVLLLGAGARAGYQFEPLAAQDLVKLIRRFLADYRGLFEDDARRSRLLDVLALFSSAGWPEALQLLHDLPDLLR